MSKIKLWTATVNQFGWDRPRTTYHTSKAAAEEQLAKYPAGEVSYAGMFGAAKAEYLINDPPDYTFEEWMTSGRQMYKQFNALVEVSQ